MNHCFLVVAVVGKRSGKETKCEEKSNEIQEGEENERQEELVILEEGELGGVIYNRGWFITCEKCCDAHSHNGAYSPERGKHEYLALLVLEGDVVIKEEFQDTNVDTEETLHCAESDCYKDIGDGGRYAEVDSVYYKAHHNHEFEVDSLDADGPEVKRAYQKKIARNWKAL